MLKEIVSVFKVVRPRHFLKVLMHPGEELRAFKYHYRRVPRGEFVKFLSGADEERLAAVEADLAESGSFHSWLKERLKAHPDGYGGQMTMEAPAVYALVRLLRPSIMVETGVADGVTSSYILRAMEDNGHGKLYSIDLPSSRLPAGKTPGWLVEDALRKRWELCVGDATKLLPPLLGELGEIDIFLHDSLHTYEHMLLEFRTAWPHLRPGGMLLSHDVGQNASFFDFIDEIGLRWRDWRVFHVLGGFRKPAK